MQILIVALLVTASALYAAWALMPAALRRAIAGFLSTCPLPPALRERFAAMAKPGSGCGCDGCDHAPKRRGDAPSTRGAGVAGPTRVQTIAFHPPAKR